MRRLTDSGSARISIGAFVSQRPLASYFGTRCRAELLWALRAPCGPRPLFLTMSGSADHHARLPSFGRYAAYVGITCGIAAVFALCWKLRDVLLIGFGSIVFAVALRTLARPVARLVHLRERWAVGVVVLLLVVGAVGVSWLFGRQIAQQLQGLEERIPRAIEEVRGWVERQPGGAFVLERVSGITDGGTSLEGLQKAVAISTATVGHAVLMFFGGIFIASNPSLYLEGFVRLFPVDYRPTLFNALVEGGEALRKWLLGQLVSMTCVGLLTGLGLWMIGAPLPLVLGIIAGLLNFIPILGPVIATGPGVLVALTDGPRTAAYAALVYFVVQELEGHAITPMAQRWAVKLPPAYGLLAVLSFALLFGFFGVLFGIPLAVVVMYLVQNLYIENALENGTPSNRHSGKATQVK
jgi:predicted PurR-regulated permease PerM